MKNNLSILLTIVLLVCLLFTGCTTKKPVNPPITAERIISAFQAANEPIDIVIVYTEATDDNKLLGRPNQYISKASFSDKRIETFNPASPNGGTIETFKTVEDLNTRKTYIENTYKSMPALTQYMYVNGKNLLRISYDLTPIQAAEYRDIFMSLK